MNSLRQNWPPPSRTGQTGSQKACNWGCSSIAKGTRRDRRASRRRRALQADGELHGIDVPGGNHSTKQGTWGLIRVEEGQLRYLVTDPRRPPSETIVTPAKPAVIEPTVIHRVEPLGAVLFHVEFRRAVSAAA